MLRRATAARIAFLVGQSRLRRSLPGVVPESTDETSSVEPFRAYLTRMFLPE